MTGVSKTLSGSSILSSPVMEKPWEPNRIKCGFLGLLFLVKREKVTQKVTGTNVLHLRKEETFTYGRLKRKGVFV